MGKQTVLSKSSYKLISLHFHYYLLYSEKLEMLVA